MTDRTARLSPDDQDLKVATAAGIAAAGGQSKAAGYCRIGQQMLSDAASPNVDRFLPLDAARDIDRRTRGAAGWPLILSAYARQIGVELFERPDAAPCSGQWHRALADLAREQAEAVAPIMEALADGRLCRRDVIERRLIAEADDVIRRWVTIRAMLEQAGE